MEVVEALSRFTSASEAGRASANSKRLKSNDINIKNNDLGSTTVATNGQRSLQLTTTRVIPLSKDNGAAPDPEKVFWNTSKAFISSYGVKNPGALIGMWARDHGKPQTKDALTRAQLEKPVELVPFIQGCFRQSTKAEEWQSPC